MTYKILSIVVPIILVIVISLAQEIILKPIENKMMLSILYVLSGIVAGIGIYFFLKFIMNKVGIGLPHIGNFKGLLTGIAIGLVVSAASGVLYYLVNKPDLQISAFTEQINIRLISNISSAIVEELGFRGGIVHCLQMYYGKIAGMLGGSIPFGIIHLVGRILGQPVGVFHVIGCTLAGLLLSLVYMKFGLLAAVGCHWIWNSLCGSWVKVFSLPKKGGVQIFEGAWTTCIVLIVVSSLLIALIYKKTSDGSGLVSS